VSQSTVSAASLKPYPTFPLTPHRASNQWCKRHRGHFHYFGKLTDWQKALAKYERNWPYIITGREPPPDNDGRLTIAELGDSFLNRKLDSLDAGEITQRTFGEYRQTTDCIVAVFGKDRAVESLTPEDFAILRAKLAEKRGPVSLGNAVQRCRTVFKHAWDNRLIDRPVHFGSSFDKPPVKAVRKARAEKGPQLFTAAELRKLLKSAEPVMRAMLLLGVNAGLGNTDVANLQESHVDLSGGWLSYPRPKTGIPRRAKLWPETAKAIRAALKVRREPRDPADAGIVFLTRWRRRFVRPAEKGSDLDAIVPEFAKLLKAAKVSNGRGYYCCRRTFQTVAEEACGDFPAISHVMGHAPRLGDMAATYRQRISDERLERVADAVRGWLFGSQAEKVKAPGRPRLKVVG
jgi:integrase